MYNSNILKSLVGELQDFQFTLCLFIHFFVLSTQFNFNPLSTMEVEFSIIDVSTFSEEISKINLTLKYPWTIFSIWYLVCAFITKISRITTNFLMLAKRQKGLSKVKWRN